MCMAPCLELVRLEANSVDGVGESVGAGCVSNASDLQDAEGKEARSGEQGGGRHRGDAMVAAEDVESERERHMSPLPTVQ